MRHQLAVVLSVFVDVFTMVISEALQFSFSLKIYLISFPNFHLNVKFPSYISELVVMIGTTKILKHFRSNAPVQSHLRSFILLLRKSIDV